MFFFSLIIIFFVPLQPIFTIQQPQNSTNNMILTADSGSTKTTWLLNYNKGFSNDKDGMPNDSESKEYSFQTQGINPFHMQENIIYDILTQEVLPEVSPYLKHLNEGEVFDIHFYGAGCTKEKSPIVSGLLKEVFPEATEIEVDSDMLGAAKALFGDEPGIACILGTGANSCLYDGTKITENVSPMGYILGDEGSGAVLGKTFLNFLYKGDHRDFIEVFESETGLTQPLIINKVYRETLPNRFLASLAPFIKKHLSESWIEEMVTDCFRLFFQRNIRHYNHPDLPCSFVGSIAFYFEDQLRKAGNMEQFHVGKVLKEPLCN